MKEIGGYIELDNYTGSLFHEKAIALNCGRNALAYIIEAKNIKKILIPFFMCDSCDNVLKQYDVSVRYYHIRENFEPEELLLDKDEWLYIVNFYGQLSDDIIQDLKDKYVRVIADYTHSYFQLPIASVDTIYTCRKFFGVADGAFLYTDNYLKRELETDESFKRMHFLLGRYERTASEFYSEYVKNNDLFETEPLKLMSKLTRNLLRGIDYEKIAEKRTENFRYLYDVFEDINKLSLIIPNGAFMYPLYVENGKYIRKELQKQNIYIPLLWPNVLENCPPESLEYQYAENILPLPVDQRYEVDDMKYMEEIILKCID